MTKPPSNFEEISRKILRLIDKDEIVLWLYVEAQCVFATRCKRRSAVSQSSTRKVQWSRAYALAKIGIYTSVRPASPRVPNVQDAPIRINASKISVEQGDETPDMVVEALRVERIEDILGRIAGM